MTHDELLAKIYDSTNGLKYEDIFILLIENTNALRAVVELHPPQEITLPNGSWAHGCKQCHSWTYPCPTIQAIEKELA
jgi:hypothetical protein